MKSELTHRFPALTSGKTPPLESGKIARSIQRLVGTVNGRGWEVAFYGGRTLAPETILGFSTSVRLVPPATSQLESIPWYYAGPRPRVFSRNYLDYDRIIMRYRRREGNMHGTRTGDVQFDRRWAVYPFDPVLGEALRDPSYRKLFTDAAAVGPRRAESPTIAIFGMGAILSVTVDLREDTAVAVAPLLGQYASFLDRLETLRGLPPASHDPIPVDYLPDESDMVYPVPRIQCPTCGAVSHPRYMTNVETEVCDKCRTPLYLLRPIRSLR